MRWSNPSCNGQTRAPEWDAGGFVSYASAPHLREYTGRFAALASTATWRFMRARQEQGGTLPDDPITLIVLANS